MTAVAQVLTRGELKQIIVRRLRLLASEADVDALRPHDDICETLEVDALDFHNFLRSVKEEIGIEVPEQHYTDINTLEKLSTYLLAHIEP